MTKRFTTVYQCPVCKTTHTQEEPWKTWIRTHPSLDSREHCVVVGDQDIIVYRYGAKRSPLLGRTPDGEMVTRSTRWHMVVEVKTHNTEPDLSQREQLWVTGRLLTSVRFTDERDETGRFIEGHEQNVRSVRLDMPQRFGGEKNVHVLSYGTHLLQFSGYGDVENDEIRWNRTLVTPELLADVLGFRRNPHTLLPLTNRAHKKVSVTPSLFDQ